MIMGGKKKVMQFQPRRPLPPKKRPPDPARSLELLTPLDLATGINNLLQALEKKGVFVSDYDHKERRLYKVTQVRGKIFFLAAEPDDETEGR